MEGLAFQIYESLPRQGPGDNASTKKAFQKLVDLPKNPEILDIGSGTGTQTLELAKLSLGNITALDSHTPFIDILKYRVRESNLKKRIRCIVGDMTSMDFAEWKFDVIWSEGAAYNMGFENALKSWKTFLKPGGYLVVSELVWFKEELPDEIREYFLKEYPDMKHFEHIYSMVESAGYRMIDYFPLPSSSWWTDYYTSAEKKIVEMRHKYQGNKEAQSLFDSFHLEMDMHRKYSEYYGYGFYIMRK